MNCSSSSVFHVFPYTKNQYAIEYRAIGQSANDIYDTSSFIAIGFWK